MQVKNKRVVVTGAASGIGKALSVAFYEAGAQSVVAVDMNIEGAEAVSYTHLTLPTILLV